MRDTSCALRQHEEQLVADRHRVAAGFRAKRINSLVGLVVAHDSIKFGDAREGGLAARFAGRCLVRRIEDDLELRAHVRLGEA